MSCEWNAAKIFSFFWFTSTTLYARRPTFPFQIICPLAGKVVEKKTPKTNKQANEKLLSKNQTLRKSQYYLCNFALNTPSLPKKPISDQSIQALLCCIHTKMRGQSKTSVSNNPLFLIHSKVAVLPRVTSPRWATRAAKMQDSEGMSDIILWQPYVTRERVSRVILLERRVAWTGNKTQFASSVPQLLIIKMEFSRQRGNPRWRTSLRSLIYDYLHV